MTVIAWDGKIVAVDTLELYDHIKTATTKLHRLMYDRETVVAYCGDSRAGWALYQWAEVHQFNPEKFPDQSSSDAHRADLIVFRKGQKPLEYSHSPVGYPVDHPYLAWGAGHEIAVAALALGKNAIEAALLACKLSNTCGEPVLHEVINET